MYQAGFKILLLSMALIVTGLTQLAASEDMTGVIAGTVKTASGQPAAGAFVKAQNAERRLLFMTVSQEQGRYRITDLPPGNYKVQSIGGGFQSDTPITVEVASGKDAIANLTLDGHQPERLDEPRHPTGPPLTDKEKEAQKAFEKWRESRAESALPEGAGKEIFKSTCTACHSLPSDHRDSREDWTATVALMIDRRTKSNLSVPSKQDQETLVNYLASNFGEDVPRGTESLWSSHLSRNWVQGAAAKYRVMEYMLPSGAGAHDCTADSEGNAWVVDESGWGIGRFDPKTLTYTRLPFPKGKAGKRPVTVGIQIDSKGHVWTMDAGNERVMEYDPKSQKFTEYYGQIGGGNAWNTLQILPDGTVWGSDVRQNRVVKLEPATGKFTFYNPPSGVRENQSVRPYGMAIDGAGKLWFAEQESNRVGKIDPKTGEIMELPMAGVATGDRPRRMDVDSNGDIWVSITELSKIVKWDYKTDKYTMFTTPTNDAGPYGVSVDRKHNLIYFSEVRADKVGRYDPKTKTFVEFDLPTMGSFIRRVQVDPSRSNRIWYSGGGGQSYDKVGYLEFVE